ncbi:MAG TPA: hypothetical protein VHX14_16090 [Thermoanaerobaculia bacterium]|jgi:hypothetical protein|nr:hypothetical protein [Thermoanaerobaculia bacterium]
MPYKVQFVGLTFFQEEPAGTMRVLMPDGRDFPPIPPHLFSIAIPPNPPNLPPTAMLDETGWKADEVEEDAFIRQYWVAPSQITLSGGETVGVLDATEQLPRLPSLRLADPMAKVNPANAKKIGDLEFRQGTFTTLRMPNKPIEDAALVSTLELDHDGDIEITLTTLGDPLNPAAVVGEKRTITLKAGTEIVFVNTSRGVPVPADADHIQIYQKLCDEKVSFVFPQIDAEEIDPLQSPHPFFTSPHAAFSGEGCSNMGI